MRLAETPLQDPTFPLPHDQPFTRAMARDAGLTDKQLGALRSEGWLRHPMRGLYVGSHVPDTLAVRSAALALVVPPDSFVTDFAAAWVHAGDIALPPNAHRETLTPEVFRFPGRNRLRNDLMRSGQRRVRPGDLMVVGPLVVTTPLRTAVDLGRLQWSDDLAMHGMDRMLALGDFTLDDLLMQVPRFRGDRGVVRLRCRAPMADGRSASFGETVLRNRWRSAGLPRPELQIPVYEDGRVLFWLDMGLEELLFAAEYDGIDWHAGREQVAHDLERREWMAERRAWHIEVFTRDHVFGRQQDACERLARAIRAARASMGERVILL
ncbi:hypothetical protein ACFP3Q_15400 [Nocardioides sp. GCM10027113]|uniref:hypothetical protein n=1 Tax=unclassified Nocardioides TaxID=2615069 RepID=UPI003609EDE7